MLGAAFHLFVLSRQFSMYETDENITNGNLRMQSVTGNETLGAPKYEENPTSLYPHEHIVNNPIPISSNTPESQGKDPNVFHFSGNAPFNSLVRTHRIAPSTSSTFWKTSINGNEPNTLNNEKVPNSNGIAALPPLQTFCIFMKKKLENIEKKEKPESKKNTYLVALSNRFSCLILCKLSSIIFVHSFLLIYFQNVHYVWLNWLTLAWRIHPQWTETPNTTFIPKRARRIKKKAVSVYQKAKKRVATESVDNVSAKMSMRLRKEINSSRRLSMRLGDRKWPSRLSSRLDGGLPTDKQSFRNLKERLEIQKEKELNGDTENPQFVKFLKYGIRGDHNEWSPPSRLRDIKIFNKKLNCSLSIPEDFSSNLVVNLPKDLNQWWLKDRLHGERKYAIYNHKLNALIKVPFGVVNAVPDDPNHSFSSHSNWQKSFASSYNVSLCSATKLKSFTTETVSAAIQTEPESFNLQSDTQLTKSLWETEFAIAEFEQQNKALLQELKNQKVSLRCANRSRAKAKLDADRTEFKLEISER